MNRYTVIAAILIAGLVGLSPVAAVGPGDHDLLPRHRKGTCPPYCDPTFGFYPTTWRAWPSSYCESNEVILSAPMPAAAPTTTPGGAKPPVMPPAHEGDTSRLMPGSTPSKQTVFPANYWAPTTPPIGR